MNIKYRGHQKRTEEAKEFWLRVATDFNGGMSVPDIAKRYINKRTGKNYHPKHIYYILRQLRKEPIN